MPLSAAVGDPHFLIDSEDEWQQAMSDGRVEPMFPPEWSDYMVQWDMFLVEGDPYPTTTGFTPAFLPEGELYVYGGGGGGGAYPEDAGLVMAWGPTSPGEHASAWKYVYGADPDLSNSTITVQVTAPQWGVTGQVNNVSFGIQDANGAIRSWHWLCGPNNPIPWGVPTTITIKPAIPNVNATSPVASGFMSNPMFNIVQSMQFIVDENAQWMGGPLPVPPAGSQIPAGLWNYWHNIMVTPNIPPKGTDPTKWSQPVVEWEPGLDPPIFLGWDARSMYYQRPICADDWLCTDDRPVTDIHWWASFIGWTQPTPPPQGMPQAFHIAIWTDVPVGGGTEPFSHPGTCVWQIWCTNYKWNFAGYDHDPRGQYENEACFQFNQYLNPEEYFYQDPGPDGQQIYWLSISAVYTTTPQYLWGWKTRPHFFQDDAVRISSVLPAWPPVIGSQWAGGTPIEYPEGESWDLAFELTTIEEGQLDFGDAPDPGYPTLLANNGARHTIVSGAPWFGDATDTPDPEPDGQPNINATGDDLDITKPIPNDDEDGVTIPPLKIGQASTIGVLVGAPGWVDAWVDWNGNGTWDEPAERIWGGPMPVGLNPVVVTPPGPYTGQTFARFRIHTDDGTGTMLPPDGPANDGEIEDHEAFIEEADQLDFGDAPDRPYPTLLASNGARHIIVTTLMLGNRIDAEADGQPTPNADGDDLNPPFGPDDEDGVTFNTALFSGVPNTVSVTVTMLGPGLNAYLNTWIDFDGNGSWADPGEQIFTDVIVGNGVNNLTFTPGPITATGRTYARFRLSYQRGLSFTGLAQNGEVEDYKIDIAPVKWLQRPDTDWSGVDVDMSQVELADDFKCIQSGPITDIHIWTSFEYDQIPEVLNSLTFRLTLYTDVPAGADNRYSHPGQAVWSMMFAPGTYNAGPAAQVPQGEWWYDPMAGLWNFPGDWSIFQYDFYIPLSEAFVQREGRIYWLGVKYLSDVSFVRIGWKSSLEHWNDDAVWWDGGQDPPVWRELRYGDGHPMAPESMDLAFAITGEPGIPPDEDYVAGHLD